VLAGQGIVPGKYDERIDHFFVLRTIEDFYGLAPLAHGDAEAQPIVSPFRKP
jgi:phosphatidylinositol-3-phosphatase